MNNVESLSNPPDHVDFDILECQHSFLLQEKTDKAHVVSVSSKTIKRRIYDVTITRDVVKTATDEPYSLCNLGLQGANWKTRLYLPSDNKLTVKVLFQDPRDGGKVKPLRMRKDNATGEDYWPVKKATLDRGTPATDRRVLFLLFFQNGGTPILPQICHLVVRVVGRAHFTNQVPFPDERGGAENHGGFPDEGDGGGGESGEDPPQDPDEPEEEE